MGKYAMLNDDEFFNAVLESKRNGIVLRQCCKDFIKSHGLDIEVNKLMSRYYYLKTMKMNGLVEKQNLNTEKEESIERNLVELNEFNATYIKKEKLNVNGLIDYINQFKGKFKIKFLIKNYSKISGYSEVYLFNKYYSSTRGKSELELDLIAFINENKDKERATVLVRQFAKEHNIKESYAFNFYYKNFRKRSNSTTDNKDQKTNNEGRAIQARKTIYDMSIKELIEKAKQTSQLEARIKELEKQNENKNIELHEEKIKLELVIEEKNALEKQFDNVSSLYKRLKSSLHTINFALEEDKEEIAKPKYTVINGFVESTK